MGSTNSVHPSTIRLYFHCTEDICKLKFEIVFSKRFPDTEIETPTETITSKGSIKNVFG